MRLQTRGAVRTIAVIAVLVLGAPSLRAQDDRARMQTQIDSLKRLVDSLRRELGRVPAIAPPGAIGIPDVPKEDHPGKVNVRFDRAKNETQVSLEELPLTESLKLTVYYKVPGQAAAKPANLNMMLVYVSKKRRASSCTIVDLLMDGAPFLLPSITHDGSVEKDAAIEYFAWIMPVDRFLEMLTASRIDGRLCDAEFSLKKPELNALRDLASRMK